MAGPAAVRGPGRAGVRVRATRRLGERISRLTEVPAGAMVELPGRGRTYLVDLAGPAGAPTVILLHGVAATATLNWFPALAELTRHYRVVLYDQRWHGRGIRSPRFDLDDLADDAVAVAELLGVDRPILAGYSLGGMVAQLVAHRAPDRVGGLVLCATTCRLRDTWAERLVHSGLAVLGSGTSGLAARRVRSAARRLPELPVVSWPDGRLDRWALGELWSTSRWALAPALAAIGRFDSTPWLASLTTPTSVVVTMRDRALPPDRQWEMAAMIAGAEVFPIAAGHTACALAADLFVPALLDACAAIAARQ